MTMKLDGTTVGYNPATTTSAIDETNVSYNITTNTSELITSNSLWIEPAGNCLDNSVLTITYASSNDDDDEYYIEPFDVNEYVDEIEKIIVNDKAVVVLWEDGFKTTAVIQGDDEFNLERGIEICLLKGLLGNNYHKLVKAGVKKYYELETAKQAEIDAKQAKKISKLTDELKRQQDERKKRNDHIYEISEGIKRAVKELSSEVEKDIYEKPWKEAVEKILELCDE